YKRSDRIGELLHREIGNILLTEVKDTRLQSVTVTCVQASDDLRQATVFVTIRGEDESGTLAGLVHAGSFIRSAVGRRCYLKYVPRLHFKLDQTLREAARIDRIINELHVGRQGQEEVSDD
ncbi:MAG: 30S ribosome-binding factor RbfA, partial [Gemmatimonadota bacterium]|nr:30S ribosome-binding factor RbfA [Gemmatimonadota bacterium]